jgi:hypothetical protein
MNELRTIDCTCGNWEQLPADQQRWHVQSFEWLKNDGDEAYYRCLSCRKQVRSKIRKEDSI